MRHVLRSTIALGALATLGVSPAFAQTGSQTGQDASQSRPRSQTEDRQRQAGGARQGDQNNMKELDGTVKQVDRESKAVRVSGGVLGLGDTTLQVTDQTRIDVQGRQGSLSDLREGARIRASYEDRQGINVAQSIEVRPAEERPQSTPSAPGTSPSGPRGQSSGSGG